ncbi:unnamed protein product [Closterium sp. NIES-54]
MQMIASHNSGGGLGGGGGRGGADRGGGYWGSACGGGGYGSGPQLSRLPENPTPQQLCEWVVQRGSPGGTVRCSYVRRTGLRKGETCGKTCYTEYRCFGHLEDAWVAEYGASEFAAALGASASAVTCASESAASAEALHTFTLDSGASRCFFRDCTTVTPLATLVPVSLADPSGGPVIARASTVLPCPAFPSDSLPGLHLPSFSTNLVSNTVLQDVWVDTFTPGGQRVAICTCSRTGRHLATFTRHPGSSQYTLTTASAQVAASDQVSASSQFAASCSCRVLSHQTLLWHHRLGHPSLLRLRNIHSHLLVSSLPRSLPPLPCSPAPPCLPCVEGRHRAAPHSSSFPPTTAPLQTLHMDVKADISGVLIPWIRATRHQLRERFRRDLPVLRLHSDRGGEFSSCLLAEFYRHEGIIQSFTLPASPRQNGIAERRIGLIMEVDRTSMIHAAAPHFLWSFAVRYAAHQLNLWRRVSLLVTSPTLRWTGKFDDASAFRVCGALSLVRDTTASKLSPRTLRCAFLGFPTDAPPWQFYHPRSCRVFSSQDVTFDESVYFYRLHPQASHPGPAPSGVSQVDPPPLVEPLEISSDSSGPAEGGDLASYDTAAIRHSLRLETPPGFPPLPSSPSLQPVAVDTGVAGGGDTGGEDAVGAETGGAEIGGAASPSGGGTVGAPAAGPGVGQQQPPSRLETPLPQQLREWVVRRGRSGAGRSGAGGTTGAARAGGAGGTGGTTGGAAGAGAGGGGGTTGGSAGAGGARGAGAAGAKGTGAGGFGGTGAAGAAGPGGARIRGTGAASASAAAGAGGTGAGGTGGTGGAGVAGPRGARTRGAGAAGAGGVAGAGGTGGTGAAGAAGLGGARTRGAEAAGGGGAAGAGGVLEVLLEVLELEVLEVLELLTVWVLRRADRFSTRSRSHPCHRLTRPFTRFLVSRLPLASLHLFCVHRQTSLSHSYYLAPHCLLLLLTRVVLREPPASSLPHFPDPVSHLARAARPTVTRLLATIVTDPDFESTVALALVTELVDFVARRPLDYVATEPPSRPAAEPPSRPTAEPPSSRAAEPPCRRAATVPTGAPRPYLLGLGRAVDFEVWVDDLQLFLQCNRADGLSLFDLTSGTSTAPPPTADSTVCSQWATRDAAARLAVRHHLPTTERAHFSQYKSAQTLYDAVVARHSSPATAALSRLMLPYLFPDLAAFPTVADLITHLRTSDTRYRAALPAEFWAKNPPPHGCSPSPLLPSVASAAAADLGGFESVGAASTPSGRRRTGKGKGGKGTGGAGGGGGGGGGGSGGGGGGGGSGGGGGGVGGSSGGGV